MSPAELLRGCGAAVLTGILFCLIGAAVFPGRRLERMRRLLSRPAIRRVALFGIFYSIAALLSVGMTIHVQSDTTAAVTIQTVERATGARMFLEEGAWNDSPLVWLLAWFSLFFDRDPLAAAAPLQFAIHAGFALLAFEMGRWAFRFLTRSAAPIVTRVRWITGGDVRLSAALVVYIAIAVLIGTIAPQATAARSVENVSGPWRHFDAVRGMRVSDVTIQLREVTALDRAFAGYYFPLARLTFLGFKPGATPALDRISERTPMFIQHLNCDGAGHELVVPLPRFGCLLLAPPAAQLERSYPFNRRFLFIDYSGMTRREPGGRWNVGPEMEWRISADPAKTSLDRDLYLNVHVNPYLPPNLPPHRVMFSFQDGGSAEQPLDGESNVSVPVKPGDWVRHGLWTLPVRVRFPDGRTMLFHELSLSVQPMGTLVERRRSG